MKIRTQLAAAIALTVSSTFALAGVSPEKAAKLGKSLTPVGAEKAGNAAGTIPAWNGKGVVTQDAEGFLINPFKNDKPLYTITAQNMGKYAEQLSEGQKRLLKDFPDTYKLPVYKSRRASAYPQFIYDRAKKDATGATLENDGNGVSGMVGSVPFPIPQSGVEVYWNHMNRYKGGSLQSVTAAAPVQANGNFTLVRFQDQLVFADYMVDSDKADTDNILFYFTRKVLAPARMTGNVLLVHEPLDQVKEPRRAWSYNAGQRRVRRAPTIAYDGPAFAAEGMRTSDNVDIFNGAPDRYDWKLVGKKEMLVPYNSYQIASRDLKYKDFLNKNHIDQDQTRYELHRVWVVEATVKEGSRHVYGKRTLYVDEDSWQIVLADHYDNRGDLWRVGEGHTVYYSNPQMTYYSVTTLYDLTSRRYLVDGLINEESRPLDFTVSARSRDFTPGALRRSGR